MLIPWANRDNITYMPWARESILAMRLIRHTNAIKRDIWKCLRLQENWQNNETDFLKRNCKWRILKRLKEISILENSVQEFNHNNTAPIDWKVILRESLKRVYKHKTSEELENKLSSLFREYELDTTSTKVHFIRAYMEIVGKIPPKWSSIPFHW